MSDVSTFIAMLNIAAALACLIQILVDDEENALTWTVLGGLNLGFVALNIWVF